jgi:hypothetical protein
MIFIIISAIMYFIGAVLVVNGHEYLGFGLIATMIILYALGAGSLIGHKGMLFNNSFNHVGDKHYHTHETHTHQHLNRYEKGAIQIVNYRGQSPYLADGTLDPKATREQIEAFHSDHPEIPRELADLSVTLRQKVRLKVERDFEIDDPYGVLSGPGAPQLPGGHSNLPQRTRAGFGQQPAGNLRLVDVDAQPVRDTRSAVDRFLRIPPPKPKDDEEEDKRNKLDRILGIPALPAPRQKGDA